VLRQTWAISLSFACVFCFTERGIAQQQKTPERTAQVVHVSTPVHLDRDAEIARMRRLREWKCRVDTMKSKLSKIDGARTQSIADLADDLVLVGSILYSRYAYGNTYFFMGEVQNTGVSIPAFVKIDLEFRSSSGAVLATDWTYIEGSNRTLTSIDTETNTCLMPGETGFFGMYTEVDASLVDKIYYSFETSDSTTVVPDARVVVSSGPYAGESLGEVELTGNLKNVGSDAAKFAQVYAALKNSSGDLLDVDFTFVDGSQIDGTDTGLWPGENGSFTMYTEAPWTSFVSLETKTAWDDAHLSSCSYTVSPTHASFDSSGGPGSVSVSTSSGCSWTASSGASFVHITSGSSGSGNGTVSYTVDANSGSNSRTGILTVAGQSFTISQAGAGTCSFAINPASASFGRAGGSGNISVSTSSGCSWTAQSMSPFFIHIVSGTSGTGPGTVVYQVDANADSASRTGSLTVAGKTFTVSQSAEDSFRYLVPGMIHAPGANGTNWRSDLAILNIGTTVAEIDIVFRDGAQSIRRSLVLDPGHTMGWNDAIASFFNVSGSASGAVDIESTAPVIVTARNYNQSGAKTFGQYLSGIPSTEALFPGRTGVLPQLRSTPGFRTNIGFVCFGSSPCPVTVQLKDATGNPVGSVLTVTIPAGGWKQLNRVFQLAGAGSVDLAFAEIQTENGSIWAYGSVVDNTSGDGTTIPLMTRR